MKDESFTPTARIIMAIVVLVFGLLVVFAGPFLIQSTLDAVMEKVASLIPTKPQFILTGVLLPIAFITMRGVGIVAGITLALIAYPLWKGEEWAWPVALSCLSLPTIFGLFTSLHYLVQFGKPAPAAIIMVAGLIAYWWVLLIKKGELITKFARFFTFTMLGLVPGHVIVLVNHGLKGLLDRPDKPMFTDPEITIYGFEAPLNFIAFIMCIIAIPLLASKTHKLAGWWLGLIAGVTVIIANYPTHIVRMKTSDFFVAGSLGVLLVVSLVVPVLKKQLFLED